MISSPENDAPTNRYFLFMTPDDLHKIETSLGLVLPPSYKEVALNHPDPQGDLGVWNLWADADRVIQGNEEVRATGFFGSDWPHAWFAIGGDGSGCLRFMEVSPADGRVHYADFNDFDSTYAESEGTIETIQEYVQEAQTW